MAILSFLCSKARSAVQNVFEPLREEFYDVIIVKGIKDFFAVFAEFDEAGRAQDAQLGGNRGLSHVERLGDVADAHFVSRKEQRKDFDAGLVTDRFEQVGEMQAGIVIELMQCGNTEFIGMRMMDFADFGIPIVGR